MRTVAIVVQVEDLVAPLCYYAQSILEERHDDEESADCGHVPVMACQQLVQSLATCQHAAAHVGSNRGVLVR